MDPLNAEYFAKEIARSLSGIMHPTLYMGTEVSRRPEEKRWLGIEMSSDVTGMDFPGFEVKSLYWDLEVFKVAIEEVLKKVIRIGFRKIVFINGHGAEDQRSTLKDLSTKYTKNDQRVLFFTVFYDEQGPMRWIGHADYFETSLALFENPEIVQLDALPPAGKLPYSKYGIAEGDAFYGKPAKDLCCTDNADPRRATSQEGSRIFEISKKRIIDEIGEAFSRPS
jgi:creatinine amidohydrolase/Fe(II)-dependent formamide hydrolase-like protein